jgi:nicotine blue oxidoreductase
LVKEIVAIVLAAGAARRLGGRPKALLRTAGGTFLERIAKTCREAGIARVAAVLASAGVATERSEMQDMTIVINPAPERGMLSSLQAGLASEAARGAAAALVWPVDCPCVPASVLRALAEAFERTGAPLVVPTSGGRGGHPALVGAALFPAILAAPFDLDGGARAVFRARAGRVERVEVGAPEVLDDVDTPEDCDRLR